MKEFSSISFKTFGTTGEFITSVSSPDSFVPVAICLVIEKGLAAVSIILVQT